MIELSFFDVTFVGVIPSYGALPFVFVPKLVSKGGTGLIYIDTILSVVCVTGPAVNSL